MVSVRYSRSVDAPYGTALPYRTGCEGLCPFRASGQHEHRTARRGDGSGERRGHSRGAAYGERGEYLLLAFCFVDRIGVPMCCNDMIGLTICSVRCFVWSFARAMVAINQSGIRVR